VRLVLICGGRGTRLGALNPDRIPKALLPIHGIPLAEYLWLQFQDLSDAPPIVIHAADDARAPAWARARLPDPVLCPQPRPDGVANACSLALPHLDAPALFLLGDVILKGTFPAVFPPAPAIATWDAAPAATTRANFGVRLRGDQVVALIEKPVDVEGLVCGLGAYFLGPAELARFADSPVNPRTGEREITEALDHLRQAGSVLRPLPFTGDYVNVNEPADVARAEALLG
jgi:glucose-1-phosphate thymidylyltransferase